METEAFDKQDLYRTGNEIRQIGNRAIRNVIKENRAMGIPLVFSRGGRIYYELPNGEVTTQSPFNLP